MTKLNDNLYEVIVPTTNSYPNVIFCRMNPSASANNWDNKWNQTSDLTIPINDNNCYTVKENTWDKGGGTWSDITSDMYFARNTEWKKNNDKVNFLLGHNSWSEGYLMDKIPNTNLYYLLDFILWSDYTEWAVANSNTKWDARGEKISARLGSQEGTSVGSKTLKLKNLLKTDGTSTELTSYTSLNYTQTIKSGANGKVKAESYKLTSANGTKKEEVTANASAQTTLSAALTATLTLTPTANTGYHFDKWNDDNTENPRTVTITSNATYTATFAINTYTVSVSANPAEGGTVSGGGTYNYGATATLTAKANSGYEFVEWQQNGTRVSTANPYTTPEVTSAATYTAIFKYKDVTFTDPSTLEFATYGKLSYQLTMNENRWYWISFPFNVNINNITTSTNGGSGDLVFTEYDAQKRATYGKGGWKEVDLKGVLTANKGYVIGPSDDAWKASNGKMVVTFPSTSDKNVVNDSLELNTTPTEGGKEQNANWHIVGTGLYHEAVSLGAINYVAVPTIINNKEDYKYYYVGEGNQNDQFSLPISQHTFKPFEAFFVQHGGSYSATADETKSAAELAPIARAKAQQNEQIYCLNMNETHTVVILNAEGSEGYTVGQDFLEMNSNGNDLIYSFDGNDALAFNHRAIEAQSIALGGYVATAGEQTISLNAYNANAEAVTLIDNLTGETADLLAGNYTFTAEVGSLDGRFIVVFGAPKAGDTTVDCYNSTANQIIAYGSANACTVSGLTTGEAVVVYNAMGQLVFATIADSETITLPSLTTGNYLILHNGTTNKVALR